MSAFNREQWLQDATSELRTWFSAKGHKVPDSIHVSVGWPNVRDAFGTTHNSVSSSDNKNHVFISPLTPPKKILVVLTHELVHCVDDCAHNHVGPYIKIAKDVGLVAPWKSSQASKALREFLSEVEGKIGPYKGAKLKQAASAKKQSTRMLKFGCRKCGWTGRAARVWLDRPMPICGSCGIKMIEM